MSSGLYSGVSGLALGAGLYRSVSGLWGGASGLINGFGGGFSPAALFASGEPGVWADIDPAYLYQDSAGTTPVTAPGQTVGMVLDRSKGLVLGPELVTNSWTRGFLSVDGTILVSGPSVTITQGAGDGSGFRWVQPITCVVGRSYRLSLSNATKVGGTLAVAAISSSSSGTGITADNSINDGQVPGQKFVVATATTMYVVISLSGGSTGNSATFTGLSVKELPGNHLTQSTLSNRAIYGIEPFGGRRNLLTYSEDLTNAVWSATAATKNTATKFTATALNNIHAVVQSFAHTVGVTYTYQQVLTYDNNRFVSLRLFVGVFPHVCFDLVNGTVAGTEAGASGTITSLGGGSYFCTITVTATSTGTGNVGVFLQPSATNYGTAWLANGTEAVSMTKAQLELGSTATAYQRVTDQWNVTEAGKTSVGYLQFDGSDDWLVSPTITPGIDKAQVFAGVRKLSDAASGLVVESSVSIAVNNGAIRMSAPVGAAANYDFQSKGTALSSPASANSFAAPITNVVSGLSDIAGDSVLLRVNGTQVAADTTTDQGTGNYLAYPLYIGRRGGISIPFNGRLYSLIVRFGANLDAATITQTENWVAGKTGIYTVDQLNRLNARTADGTLYNAYAAADASSNNYLVTNAVRAADGTSYNVI